MSIHSNKGFTLLEILIVLIILGVIAGLAIPAFTSQVEKNRGQEALSQLALMRESVARYQAQQQALPGAINMPACNGAGQVIDYNPRCSTGTLNFDYAVTAAGAVTATRNANNNPGNCQNTVLTLALAGGNVTSNPANGCYV